MRAGRRREAVSTERANIYVKLSISMNLTTLIFLYTLQQQIFINNFQCFNEGKYKSSEIPFLAQSESKESAMWMFRISFRLYFYRENCSMDFHEI
jgi:hypothetical protein